MSRRRIVAAALLALLTPAAASAQGPAFAAVDPAGGTDDRSWTYAVDWGPVSLAQVKFSLTRRDGETVAASFGESRGLAALMADFKIEQRAVYGADGARRFESVSRWNGDASRRDVAWHGDGLPQVALTERPEDEGPLTPIAAHEMTDTVDPAFPLVDALRRVEAGDGCGGTWRIFDGVRRMNITLIDEGPDTVDADRDWTYGGPALRCRLRLERIGGFPVDREPRAQEVEYDRLLWIATLPEGPAPVRLRVSWPLGNAIGRIDLR